MEYKTDRFAGPFLCPWRLVEQPVAIASGGEKRYNILNPFMICYGNGVMKQCFRVLNRGLTI